MTTIKLDFPITVDGREYVELTMRRPKVKDKRAAMKVGGDQADQEIRLFANLCEVPPSVMDELDEADYMRLQKAYVDFLEPALASQPVK